MRRAALFLVAAAFSAPAAPRIVYTKSFPGSVPPWVSVVVESDGQAVYTDAPSDPQPVQFQLKPEEATAIFALAEKLGYFDRPLESGLKVASMGVKTFRFEDGGKVHEVKFNYSLDPDAQALLDWFERISETVGHLINVERTARYDRLGLDKALLQLQASLERGRLAGVSQLLPVLDRIAKNGVYMNRVRERAQSLAQILRGEKPKSE